MTNYSLETLLKVRKHHKSCAERTLTEAVQNQELAEIQFSNTRNKIINNKNLRAKMADSFFEKTRMSPSRGPDIMALIYSVKKNIGQEEILRQNLAEQAKIVQNAKEKQQLAINNLLVAHVDLKIINNHHLSWQQKIRRAEELSTQYESDDQNATRYCLKKRA